MKTMANPIRVVMFRCFISHNYHYVVRGGWRVMGSSSTVAKASLMLGVLLLVGVVQGRLETHRLMLNHFPVAFFSIMLYLEYLLGLRGVLPPLLLLVLAVVSGQKAVERRPLPPLLGVLVPAGLLQYLHGLGHLYCCQAYMSPDLLILLQQLLILLV